MNQMSELSPSPKKVLVLNAIKPTPESARSETLEYANLSNAAASYSSDDKLRQEVFWNSPEDSLEERQAAQQLATQYMLMGAAKLNYESVRPESKQLWSDRYSEATSEIYGSPEAVTAKNLLMQQVSELVADGRQRGVDTELLSHFVETAQSYGLELGEADKLEKPFANEAKAFGEILSNRYGNAFDALDLETAPRQINMNDFKPRVERALTVLAGQHDPSWAEWRAVSIEDKDQLSVDSGKKVINIGMKRADVTPTQAKALFGHEVLDHGLRAVNGVKLSKELGSGLSGYLDAEEGLGIFFEYAITGEIPDKAVDRYADIALALGQIDGQSHTRADLLDFAMTRALIRNELTEMDLRKPDEEIQKEVYAHVNRIYRGSLGNEYPGIFTKDISYYAGFQHMGQYISSEIEGGKSYEDIFDYMVSGKFDPTNQQHVAYLDAIRNA